MRPSHPHRIIALLLPLALASSLSAQEPATEQVQAPLTAPDDRITDEAIDADYSTYQATQDRIQALNDGGRPVRDYHLSKAQCWLDVSFHEYSRNDRSDFPQQALDESVKLIDAMERNATPLPTDTPLVNDARRLREDLWKRLGAIHGTPGFDCAQQVVACGEVELVHAGNEFNQQQWRHAKPYIQMAEDAVDEAEALARQCTPVPQNMELTANLLFEFDADTMQRTRPESMQKIDALLRRIQDEKLKVTRVELRGHADRIQGPDARYNQALSERRALAVRDYLIERGVAPQLISYEWAGDREPVQFCDDVSGAALRACLQPNRRVEVKVQVER